jgi:hypothetical protein
MILRNARDWPSNKICLPIQQHWFGWPFYILCFYFIVFNSTHPSIDFVTIRNLTFNLCLFLNKLNQTWWLFNWGNSFGIIISKIILSKWAEWNRGKLFDLRKVFI